MTQNIYDTPAFFEGYSKMSRSVEGLAGAPEWPALQALLPPMSGLNVVDLGCGYGWFSRWAQEQGAAQVLGLDVSHKMLARARAMTSAPTVTYAIADLEQLDLPAGTFDWPTAPWRSITSSTSSDCSRRSIKRWCRVGGWCFPSSTRSSWRRATQAGRSMLKVAKAGRWTVIRWRGHG